MKFKLLSLVIGLALTNISVAKTIVKLGHYNSDTHPSNIALVEVFKKEVEEKTNNRFEVRIYPNNQIGGEDQVLNGIRNGTIEMGITGGLLQNVDPLFGVWELPNLFSSNEEAHKVFESEVGQDIAKKMEKYGIKLLAYGMNGFRVVSSNKKIEKFEDFDGLRLRVPLNSQFVAWANSLGVAPQSMPLSEVFTSLEQNVIDAQENPYQLIKDSGLYEVQKYIVETNHIFTPGLLQMSKKFWDKLSKEDQAIFVEASKKYNDKEWELAIDAEDKTKAFLKDKGLEIIIPDEQFKQKMYQAGQVIYDDYYKKHEWAKDLIERINKAK